MKKRRVRTIYRLKGYRKTKDGMYVRYVPCWSCKGSLYVTIMDSDGSPEEEACTECHEGKVKDLTWPDSLEDKWLRKSNKR